MTALLHAAAALVVAASGPRHLLFGEPGTDWVVLSETGEVRFRLREVGGVRPWDVAISSDAKRWAVAIHEERQKPVLLLFTSLEKPPRRIVARGDVLDDLQFSADGEWVYFSSNDDKQKPFDNQPMKYAQVYRVKFDRGEPERVSWSRGCHMWPRPLNDGKTVLVSHATCFGGRSLELLHLGSQKEDQILPTSASVRETALHPDGKSLLLTQEVPAGIQFRKMNLDETNSELWLTTRTSGHRIRPQWSEQGTAMVFQNNRRVWKLQPNGEVTLLLSLESEQ